MTSTKNELKVTFFDSSRTIPEGHWNAVVQNRNIFLSLPYLEAMEEALHGDVDYRYILFYNDKYEAVAAAVVQILNFIDKDFKYEDQLCKLRGKIANSLIQSMDLKVMVCGNAFSTGENGFLYTDAISGEEAFRNLADALVRLRSSEKVKGSVSLMLLKDFWPDNFKNSDILKDDQFRDFMIDVNMVLKIHPSWTSFDAYLDSLVTKFRTKAKSVLRKSEWLRVRRLTVTDIEQNIEQIEWLYENVLEKADFKFGQLNGKAFISLKRELGDQFFFNGYFLNEKMVGFSSAFISEGLVDANYVGIDYELNFEYAIYQRMLYDYVELAIQLRANELRLGRTAEEIKSCIGAEPVNMKLYLKHRNRLSNKLIKPIIESITPSDFELRKPFKQDFLQQAKQEVLANKGSSS